VSYLRTIDPYPLESAEQNKLHEFYTYLAQGRLTTTKCAGCGRTDWPPRGFCPECGSDRYTWIDLPSEGTIHAFTVQETGIPAGYKKPLTFSIVNIAGLRIFSTLLDADPAALALGARVRMIPLRVADDYQGTPRYLPAFRLIE
jgi:uncharacterized OB-fold protein